VPESKTYRTYLILLALWLMVFAASSQVMIISPILPRIGEAFGVNQAKLGWLVSVYAAMLTLFALITGPVSDKFGRRRILLIGTIFLAAALYLHGLAQSFYALLVMRALAGVGGGMLSGAAVAYVGDYFPYDRRGWANGWIMSGIALGQILGVPIGGALADFFDFRVPFVLFAVLMTLATLLIVFYVPQPDVQRSTARLSVGSALRGYADLFRMPHPRRAALSYLLMFFAIGFYVVFLPTWLEEAIGLSGTETASLFIVGGLTNVVTGPIAGKLSDRIGRKPLIVISCLAMGVVMGVTTLVVDSLFTAYVFFGLAMITVGMRISPLQSLVTALVSGERRGMLMSLVVAVGNAGMFLSSALVGWVYTASGFLATNVIAAASIFAMAALVQLGLPEPKGDAEAPAAPVAEPAEAVS
jgi:predicted MFS family arabinose efflux permease